MEMRRFAGVAAAALVAGAGWAAAEQQVGGAVALVRPDAKGGMPLMEALANRKSERSFKPEKLSRQQLSALLWAANGINRDDGKRTAPAAMNIQAVDLYVVMEEGIFIYDPAKNELVPVASGDLRKATGGQPFVAVASVNLVWVADFAKFKANGRTAKASSDDLMHWAYVTAGCQAQNVNLYCASAGLGAVVRGSIDGAVFGPAAKLRSDQQVVLAQTVGVPGQPAR